MGVTSLLHHQEARRHLETELDLYTLIHRASTEVSAGLPPVPTAGGAGGSYRKWQSEAGMKPVLPTPTSRISGRKIGNSKSVRRQAT